MIKLTITYAKNNLTRFIDATIFIESIDVQFLGGFSININIRSSAGVLQPINSILNVGTWDLFDVNLVSGNLSAVSIAGKDLTNNNLIPLCTVSYDPLAGLNDYYVLKVNSTGPDTFFDGTGSVIDYTSTSLSIAPPAGGVFITGESIEGTTLTASNTLTDADGIPQSGAGAIHYQWRSDGVDIALATSSSLVLTQSDVGKVITVIASYTDMAGHFESFSTSATAAVTNVNDAPTGSVTITGSATQGQPLTATNTLADVDGIPTTGTDAITYQWQADGYNIIGATDTTLVLGQAQVGKAISVLAHYTDAQGTNEIVASSATADVAGNGTHVDVLAYSWKAHTLLDGVNLQHGSQSVATNTNGATSFIADTSLISLTASLAIPTADATATLGAVNLQDAIAILKMIVGLDVNGAGKPLSPYQALAADFDGNGNVGLTDAIGVLKHVVGLTAPDPVWHFVNEADTSIPNKTNLNPGVLLNAINADLGNSSPAHVGLVGYLSGDVDGSYAGAVGALDLDITQPHYFQDLTTATGLSLSQFGM